MKLLITHNKAKTEWDVWAALEEDLDVIDQPFSFIIGVGKSYREAVQSAANDLSEALRRLEECPRGEVEEREVED